jgi:hypothetical protein
MKKKHLPKKKTQKTVALSGLPFAADLQKRAMARAEFAARPAPASYAITFCKPTGEAEGPSGAQVYDSRQCQCRGKTYDRMEGETYEAFQQRVLALQPQDGRANALIMKPVFDPDYVPQIEVNPFDDAPHAAELRKMNPRQVWEYFCTGWLPEPDSATLKE